MILKFVDRVEELRFLEDLYRQKSAQFVIIYGRRRIGKTELIKHFISGKKSFYFMARKEPIELEIKRFTKNFNRKFNVFIEAESLEDLFARIKEMGRIIIIVDEFSYWVSEGKNVTSELQYIWDEILKNSKVFLILLGSSISTMESLMSYKNPLYGRRTAQIKLGSVGFFHIKELYNYGWEELVKLYACIGGIPAYFQYVDDGLSVEDNIERMFFNRMSVLYEDAEQLLKDELRDPVTYLNILYSINTGKTKFSEISGASGVAVTNIPKYLRKLEALNLIRKDFPVDAPGKSRRGVYRVLDHYYRFWLRFVYPYKDDIEMGTLEFSALREKFNRYLGEIYEDVAREFLVELSKTGKLPIKIVRIGRWWFRNNEIDIVAVGQDDSVGFFEVKWRKINNQSGEKIISNLRGLSEKVNIHASKKYFGIIAKEFPDKERLREEGYLVYDLRDFNIVKGGK